MHAKSLQSCPTLWNPMDCRPTGSSVDSPGKNSGVEWAAMSSSIDPLMSMQGSNLHLLHWQMHSLPLVPCEKGIYGHIKDIYIYITIHYLCRLCLLGVYVFSSSFLIVNIHLFEHVSLFNLWPFEGIYFSVHKHKCARNTVFEKLLKNKRCWTPSFLG